MCSECSAEVRLQQPASRCFSPTRGLRTNRSAARVANANGPRGVGGGGHGVTDALGERRRIARSAVKETTVPFRPHAMAGRCFAGNGFQQRRGDGARRKAEIRRQQAQTSGKNSSNGRILRAGRIGYTSHFFSGPSTASTFYSKMSIQIGAKLGEGFRPCFCVRSRNGCGLAHHRHLLAAAST